DRQELPEEPLEVEVDRELLTLDRDTVAAARDRARRTDRPHNLAKPTFSGAIIEALARQEAERLGAEFLDQQDIADIRAELRAEPVVQDLIDQLWPTLTPHQLLTDLYASEDRLAAAGLPVSLHREPSHGFTEADVPLLYEARELLGVDDRAERAAEARRERAAEDYAQGVLDILQLEDDADPDILTA